MEYNEYFKDTSIRSAASATSYNENQKSIIRFWNEWHFSRLLTSKMVNKDILLLLHWSLCRPQIQLPQHCLFLLVQEPREMSGDAWQLESKQPGIRGQFHITPIVASFFPYYHVKHVMCNHYNRIIIVSKQCRFNLVRKYLGWVVQSSISANPGWTLKNPMVWTVD